MDRIFGNKVALVTGSSYGIGEARDSRHAGIRRRLHRQQRIYCRAGGLPGHAGLRGVQARAGGPDPQRGPGLRPAGHPRQRRLPRRDPHAHGPARHGRAAGNDRAAREGRKKFPPERSAAEWAAEIGIELLDEAGYAALQALEPFDRKTSSWLRTPAELREKGGALFGDRRFGRVFVYHNGAESYYAARGFRGRLLV